MRLNVNRAPGSLPERQRGVTLVEVLIAVLVLSIGLLGMAALQTVSLQTNHSAYMRSQATALAYDMADRMRANRQAALNGDYERGYDDSAPAGTAVAALDMADWVNALAATLPTGAGMISCDPVGCANGMITVGVRWQDARGERAPDDPEFEETFLVTTRL